MNLMTELIFAGPLPPPVHGQSVATKHMLELLTNEGLNLHVYDTGPGSPKRTIRRVKGHLAALAALLNTPAVGLYASVNEHRGIVGTIMLALLARLRGKRIILHHHSARSLVAHRPLFACLVRVAGPECVHLIQGKKLVRQMKMMYGTAVAMSYSNIGLLEIPSDPQRPPGARLRLGHLSNLSKAKGVGWAIRTLERALAEGIDAQLILAGPCTDSFAEEAVRQAKRVHGERVQWLGPLYGVEKETFFNKIDIFLFPTMYIPETQGIVNLEALSYGRPVIGYNRGCIADDLGSCGGAAVPLGSDFAKEAIPHLKDFLADREAAFTRARRRFIKLLSDHRHEQQEFLEFLCKLPFYEQRSE